MALLSGFTDPQEPEGGHSTSYTRLSVFLVLEPSSRPALIPDVLKSPSNQSVLLEPEHTGSHQARPLALLQLSSGF